jgi:hypothetical protein
MYFVFAEKISNFSNSFTFIEVLFSRLRVPMYVLCRLRLSGTLNTNKRDKDGAFQKIKNKEIVDNR